MGRPPGRIGRHRIDGWINDGTVPPGEATIKILIPHGNFYIQSPIGLGKSAALAVTETSNVPVVGPDGLAVTCTSGRRNAITATVTGDQPRGQSSGNYQGNDVRNFEHRFPCNC